MTITWTKLLRWFYYLTVIVYSLGVVVNIVDNTSDIYQVWGLLAFWVGVYLMKKR